MGGNNNITDAGCVSLEEVLQQNTTITMIDLSNTRISDEFRSVLEDIQVARPSLQIKY